MVSDPDGFETPLPSLKMLLQGNLPDGTLSDFTLSPGAAVGVMPRSEDCRLKPNLNFVTIVLSSVAGHDRSRCGSGRI